MTQSPALSLQYEHGMWSAGGPGVISLGGFLAYKTFGYDYNAYAYSYSQKWKYTLIGVRSAYHYNGIDSKNWDLYGGLMLAYRIISFDNNDLNRTYSYPSDVYLSAYLGARYYFSENVAGFVELGSGIAILNLGIALKF